MVKRSSGSGERTARKGLRFQDRASAVLAYRAILEGTLSFIALADDQAGMFDDFVIGVGGQVVGHQYKSSTKPKPVGVRGLLLGKDNVIADCAMSFRKLELAFPQKFVKVRYVTSHYASVNDKDQFGVKGRDSSDFFEEKALYPDRALADWRAGIWQPLIDELLKASGLSDNDFERFFSRFEIVLGAPGRIDLNLELDSGARAQIVELALALGDLAGRDGEKTRWSRRELLDELGWPDRFRQRFEHRFPLGAHIQSNEKSETELERALTKYPTGYLCLLGPPGAGKSTLLERFVRSGPGRSVVRYLAYVPGLAQQQGRGEAENFLADLNSQLSSSGLDASRAKDDTLEQHRETFARLLDRASERYNTSAHLTIIVVDGLDHVPREEKPESSFLRALPLPQSVPQGVLFVLGSQRIDLTDIPRDVRDQASLEGRKIEIAPLTIVNVENMIASVGLSGAVEPNEVFSVSLGHPLVTQYLLLKLLSASIEERMIILAGGFEYDGDLERVYHRAWREAQEADPDIPKVLLTLSFVEGRIEPELLAKCLTRQAVNNTFKVSHHLIDHSVKGWQIFHNSFRLFLRQQTIELYGAPDPDFCQTSIYRRLAELSLLASDSSVQRWLEFRYRFLARDREEAAAIACRKYFIGQFIDGRDAYDVNSDVRDAFACLGSSAPPEYLFDLMLAKDEIWRRHDALGMSQHLVAAQIAAGDLDVAIAQLDSDHTAGDEWLVIKALLENGLPESARAVFDEENPWEWFDERPGLGDESLVENWADYAVVMLDKEQIERRIRKPEGKDEKRSLTGQSPDDYLRDLRFALARSTLRHASDRRVREVTAGLNVTSDEFAILHLESAEANLGASRHAQALVCLRDYEACCDTETLDSSWHVHAAQLAVAGGDTKLASRLFERAETPDLCNLEYKSQEVEESVQHLILYCAVAAQVGKKNLRFDLPKEHLFRAAQNHANRLGAMIGNLRAEQLSSLTTVSAQIKASLVFLAGAAPGPDDDVMLSYRIGYVYEPIFSAICRIVQLVPEAAPAFSAEFEACLRQPICAFRERVAIHCQFVETMFGFDGSASSATARLEGLRHEVETSRSPSEAIDRLSRLAITYGRIDLSSRARELLHEMRRMSLGTNLAAKKDGQYQVWADLLVAANQADPERAAKRSLMMLQFIAGVVDSEGDDQAYRISKTALVEAIACNPTLAWEAFDWARASGIWKWDALVDAAVRGVVRRRAELVLPLATTWASLSLPYYSEVYNSITRNGQFLRDLVSATPTAELAKVLPIVVLSLERDAKPSGRSELLRILRDALADRGITSEVVSVAIERWNAEPGYDEEALPDYFYLDNLSDVEVAITLEREQREAKSNTVYGGFVSDKLGKRIGRIISKSKWEEVESFVIRNPRLVQDEAVKLAVAKVAMLAGQRKYAEALLIGDQRDRKGWGGWADRGLLEYHKARHFLGVDNAHKEAREDFVRDLVAGGSGTSSALWDVSDIFPVLFDEINWPDVWDRLAEQIEGNRDYWKNSAISSGNGVEHDDIDLLVRLFLEALGFGVSDPRQQAIEGLLSLVRLGWSDLFCRTCRQLVSGPDALLGARLLFEVRDNKSIELAFRDEIKTLLSHEDVCVAVIGEILCDLWGVEAYAPKTKLPFIYLIDLPPMDEMEGRSLRDEHSLGPIIDDPMVWTEGFERWVNNCSEYSRIPVENIRRRVAQLVSKWGGVNKYGAKSVKLIENNLYPMGLLLPFPRPHISVCMRALRVIVGELWRDGRLSNEKADLLLHRLTGAPVLPPRFGYSARPADVSWPLKPKNPWRSEAVEWISAKDIERRSLAQYVLGEWARFVILESGSLLREDMLVSRELKKRNEPDLERAIAELPQAYWGLGSVMAIAKPTDAVAAVRNLNISLVGDCAEAIMFDPLLGRHLGWHQLSGNPLSFANASDELMVTTRFWRDGWPQQMRHADFCSWGIGQRVELTEAGWREFGSYLALPEATVARWRSLQTRQSDQTFSSQWRSG